MTPVVFGSALRHFGVKELLDTDPASRRRAARAEGEDQGQSCAGRPGQQGSHRLRVQDPGEHGPKPPRQDRVLPHGVRPVPARHATEDGGGQAAWHHLAGDVHGAGPRDRGRGVWRRRDRHSKPWSAARGRRAVGKRQRAVRRASRTSRRKSCVACARRTR